MSVSKKIQYTSKLCGKCGKIKPIDGPDGFPKKTATRLHSWCKKCHSEYSREHYKQNKDKKIQQVLNYQKQNKDKVREYVNKYRQKLRNLQLIEPESNDDQNNK